MYGSYASKTSSVKGSLCEEGKKDGEEQAPPHRQPVPPTKRTPPAKRAGPAHATACAPRTPQTTRNPFTGGTDEKRRATPTHAL